MSPLLEKQNQKISNILEATLQVMDEFGFEGSSMALIAEKSNVAAGTIYRYFKNKEDLLNALYKETLTNLVQNLNFLAIEG
ncbi:MAG: helix-turn-helix domain-containing protein, partial [Spirochaetota bacterium]